MSKIKLTALLLCYLAINLPLIAQEKCGSMDLLRSYLSEQSHTSIKQLKQQFAENAKKNTAKKNKEVITISCVVHVVYRTVNENISDETIYDAIAVLNEDFRALVNLDNIYEEFQDDAADAEIEFCLANVDPYGNPTKGINRIKTEITDFGDDYNEDKIKFTDKGGADAWPNSRYLNIWIGNISNDGLLGYAQFPGFGQVATDGIVIDDRSFGRAAGSSNISDDGTTSHEIGHWLGLFHIWGDDCETDDNGVETCRCSGSDGIYDTNNSQGPASGCQKQSRSCGSADMIQNFMDYSNCSEFFTQGQIDVMRAVLEPGGFRSGIATANRCVELIENDVAVIDIEFPVKNEVVCTQNFSPRIQFANNGSDTLKQATFKILINETKEFSHDWTGELLFADYETIELTEIEGNIGTQKISISVENVNGVEDTNTDNNSIEHNFQIKILEAARLPFRDGFETGLLDTDKWSTISGEDDKSFVVTNTSAHFGEQCIKIDNFSVNEAGQEDELITQNLNIASFTEPKLIFYYAAANKRTEPAFDELQVLFTNDCGVHFDTLFQAIGDDLASTSKTDDLFQPVGSQWKKVTIDLDDYKDEAFANIHFKFISGLGNNFYLDDISITGKDPVTSVFNSPFEGNYNYISPNPFKDQVQINLPNKYLSMKMNITVYNSTGKLVKYISAKNNKSTLQLTNIKPGIYYLNLQIDDEMNIIQKMIKL